MPLPEFLSTVTPHELIGLAGAAIYAGTYGLVAYDRLSCLSPAYYASQLAAASLVMASLTEHFNLASATIQAFFICVSIIGVWRHLGRRAGPRGAADGPQAATVELRKPLSRSVSGAPKRRSGAPSSAMSP